MSSLKSSCPSVKIIWLYVHLLFLQFMHRNHTFNNSLHIFFTLKKIHRKVMYIFFNPFANLALNDLVRPIAHLKSLSYYISTIDLQQTHILKWCDFLHFNAVFKIFSVGFSLIHRVCS